MADQGGASSLGTAQVALQQRIDVERRGKAGDRSADADDHGVINRCVHRAGSVPGSRRV